jgi:hypothetical protein
VPDTMTYTGSLTVMTCWCGMTHAVPAQLASHQRRCHDEGRKVPDIFCPLGHMHVPAGKPEHERLREQLERSEARRARAVAERDQAEASARAYKGAATRAKRRAAAALCPCCNRSFVQLRRHMASQHPDYDPEAVTA